MVLGNEMANEEPALCPRRISEPKRRTIIVVDKKDTFHANDRRRELRKKRWPLLPYLFATHYSYENAFNSRGQTLTRFFADVTYRRQCDAFLPDSLEDWSSQ